MDRPQPPADDPVALLVRADGDVRYQRADRAGWIPAADGRELRADEAVQTMDRAHASVRFREGGVTARLGPGTTLRIPAQAPTVTRLRHLAGRLVTRVDEQGMRVEVELPPGTLVLDAPAANGRAAEAEVEVSDGRTDITILAGEGRLERGAHPSVRITESHFVAFDPRGAVIDQGAAGPAVEPFAPAEGAVVRTRGSVRFEWRPLPDADGYRLLVRPTGGGPTVASSAAEPSAVLELATGDYVWSVRGIRGHEPLPVGPELHLRVELDRDPPELRLASPAPGASVSTTTVLVEGRTEPGAALTVDGTSVAVPADGRFSLRQPVPRGLANIVVVAHDDLGNARIISRSVVRE